MEKKTVIMTIGRMNPPTYGHKKLIEQMVAKAAEIGEREVYIILSDNFATKIEDGVIKENPLTCPEKTKYIAEIVKDIESNHGVKVIIRCMDAQPNPPVAHCDGKIPTFKQICILVDEFKSYIPDKKLEMLLMVGTDRFKSYGWLEKVLGPDVPIKFGEVVRRNALKIPCQTTDCLSEANQPTKKAISTLADEESMSATKLKNLARQKEQATENDSDKKIFIIETARSGLKMTVCEELYQILNERLMSQVEYDEFEEDIAEKASKKKYKKERNEKKEKSVKSAKKCGRKERKMRRTVRRYRNKKNKSKGRK